MSELTRLKLSLYLELMKKDKEKLTECEVDMLEYLSQDKEVQSVIGGGQ